MWRQKENERSEKLGSSLYGRIGINPGKLSRKYRVTADSGKNMVSFILHLLNLMLWWDICNWEIQSKVQMKVRAGGRDLEIFYIQAGCVLKS